jgi:hypothetical protein
VELFPFDRTHHKVHRDGAHNIRVILLEADVEGHEESVLLGASRALNEKRIRAITLGIMEGHGDTTGVARLLRGTGLSASTNGAGSTGNIAYLPSS